ncbi:hypothetical protein L1987_12867 [Smallanthus sonchifolius]|uniref:Uncharacterized protein n=1 Tax=Smallanthus sonchifolius TaxID=185202 RepID=A0ACB9JFI8_9ASTR|nr:hypothetical protein L1987_12867 [Smallanthus sonchifolius]
MTLFIKPALIFLVFVLVTGFGLESRHQTMIYAQARPLSLISPGRYEGAFDTLGMICKCCDRLGGNCTSRWNGSCSNLQCIPWRLH